jgi:biotin carboxyl carrier protein
MGLETTANPGPGELQMATKILAPLDGKFIRIYVDIGDAIEENEPNAMIEAFKNEMPIRSPIDETVAVSYVRKGDSV